MTDSHTFHSCPAGHAGDVFVSVVQVPDMPVPQIYIRHLGTGREPVAGRIFASGDALVLATILRRLGHEDVAVLIEAAVSAVNPRHENGPASRTEAGQ